jgi:formiminotetrahydrofolate cyclodeaminase
VTIGNQTLDSFLGELGSSAAVPGGGAASAVSGALAAGLVAMVAELSVGRPKYERFAATIEFARDECHRLEKMMVELADADADAFAGFMVASGLRRSTPEEIAARKAALATAARLAIEPPRQIVAACREVASACERLAGRSNLGLASDLVVASRLVEGAAHGGLENVLVNLPALGDAVAAEALESGVRKVQRSVSRLARAARAQMAKGALREPEAPRKQSSPAAVRQAEGAR